MIILGILTLSRVILVLFNFKAYLGVLARVSKE